MAEEAKAKNKGITWKPAWITAAVTLAFVALIGMVVVLTGNIVAGYSLQLRSDVERKFYSIYLVYQSSPTKALQQMEAEGVSTIAVYDTDGTLEFSLGGIAPEKLDVTGAEIADRPMGGNLYTGIMRPIEELGEVEYVRFTRDNTLISTGIRELLGSRIIVPSIEFPEILYIRSDSQGLSERVRLAEGIAVLSIILLLLLYVFILRTNRRNRLYRDTLRQQESLVSLGSAARTLAHEIKNPLSAITIQLALLKKTTPPENAEDLKIIEQEVSRLRSLTDEIGEFLRNPVGKPTEICPYEISLSLVKLFAGDVAISAESTEAENATVTFDPDRFRSVLENLIKNAFESAEEGKPNDVSIDISLPVRRKTVRIVVADRGKGLPQGAERKQIFDPFYTTKIHGSGIGLSICRQFAEAAGGSVTLKDRDGGGTEAILILPRRK